MLATTYVLLAVEDRADDIVLAPDAAELIWGLVAFLALLGFMYKYVFPKLSGALEERSAAIEGRMADAERKLEEAEESRRAFEASMADAKGEANRIVEEARATAESLRADILAKAESEAAEIVERAQTEIAAERDRAVQELRNQMAAISVQLASRIVDRELDASTHEELVDEYIEQLTSQN